MLSNTLKTRVFAMAGAALGASLLIGSFGLPVKAQTASVTSTGTPITVEVPDIVILTVPSELDISINPSSSANSDSSHTTATINYDPKAGTLGEGNAGVVAVSTTASGTVKVNNFWQVQSIASGPAKTQVSVSFASGSSVLIGTLTGPGAGTDEIGLSNLATGTAADIGSGASVTFNPTGLGGGQSGNVSFDIDLDSITRSGTYTGATIYVTAETL